MPIDFSKKREIKTKSMVLKLEIELIDSIYTPDEAAERIQMAMERSNDFSNLIVFLLRTTGSSMWEQKSLELN